MVSNSATGNLPSFIRNCYTATVKWAVSAILTQRLLTRLIYSQLLYSDQDVNGFPGTAGKLAVSAILTQRLVTRLDLFAIVTQSRLLTRLIYSQLLDSDQSTGNSA